MAGLHTYHKHAIICTETGIAIDTFSSKESLARAAIHRAAYEVGPENVGSWLEKIASEFNAEFGIQPKESLVLSALISLVHIVNHFAIRNGMGHQHREWPMKQ